MAKMISSWMGDFKCISIIQVNSFFSIISGAEFLQVKISMNEKEVDFSSNTFILKIKYFLKAFLKWDKFLISSSKIV
jgi:hypothetical protein